MRARRWAWCSSVLLAAGCVTHRGSWRTEPDKPVARDGVAVVLLAGTAPEDRGARAVAQRVAAIVDDPQPPVVLWLGGLLAHPLRSATPRAVARGPRCEAPDSLWSRPAGAILDDAMRDLAREGRSFAVAGALDHRCEGHEALRREEAHPWRIPATHYVLRVHDDASVQVRAQCGDGGCRFETTPSEATPLVELVVVDLGPWLHPADDAAGRRLDDLQVLSLEQLLASLAATATEAAPPRLLVSSVPVEAAGEHGLGTLWPEATFHALPTALQRALADGRFVGVLSAYDRSLVATPDLFDAIKRADRVWLRSPLFQLQAGAVAAPNRRHLALRRRRVKHSQAYRAPVLSDHRGFAVVRLRSRDADLELHARRDGHWETATITVPLRPRPHPDRTPSPVMVPCRDCPRIPAEVR